MAILIIVIAIFLLAVIALSIEQWADGADSIDSEEKDYVEGSLPRLIFSSGGFDIVEKVEKDYSHIRI